MKKLLTANRLIDGVTVYLTSNGSWSMHLQDAWRIEAAGEELDHAEAYGRAAEARNIIVAPYLIDALDQPAVAPARLRERIRAEGPTVLDHQVRAAFAPEG